MHTKLLVLCMLISCIIAVPINRQSEKKPFSFDDIFRNSFSFRGFNGTWISDEQFIFRNGDLNTYRASDGDVQLFLNTTIFSNWRSPSYTFSADYSKLLIRYDVTQIFRHSIVARYDTYNIANGEIVHIGDEQLLNFCVWSPNSQDVAFVRNNDVFIHKANGTETQLTFDGEDGIIYNGVPDWVYEEEVLGSGGALWFSPDGNKIAIASFDDTEVEEFTYIMYNDQYETEIALRYPKAGRTNPTVSFKYIDLNANLEWHIFAAPIERVTEDHILYSVNWITNDQVGAFWLNRRQNLGSYQICSATTAVSCYEAFMLSEPEGWVSISTPRCTPSGSHCFFTGFENNGQWINVQRYTLDTPFVVPISMYPQEHTVQGLSGFSDDGNDVYFTATLPNQPQNRHVFKNADCLTCGFTGLDGEVCDYASASFSKSYTYFAFTCSGPRPSYTRIYRTSDKAEMVTWEENLASLARLEEYDVPAVHFENVTVVGGFQAAVKLTLPSEIDINAATHTKKYAMVVEVYAGPNSVQVSNSFSIGFKDYQVTTHKIIHCRIDGRGSGNRGKNFLFTINNKMGTVEIEDQIAVTKYLQQKYAFIDESRTGIWGWSYGGYATAMALSTDTEKVFQCGVSVAPVSAWIYYDSIYTERYMGLPILDDNLINYNATDVSQHIGELKNHEFLLMHGNADDNVHFQQSMALTKALVDADVQFEQASYPNENHGLGGVSNHVYHTIDRFWINCLKLDE